MRSTAGTKLFGQPPGKFLYITSPGGFEKLVEKTSLLTSRGPPDMQKVMETARQDEIEFISSGNR